MMLLTTLLAALLVAESPASRARAQELQGRLGLRRGRSRGLLSARVAWVASQYGDKAAEWVREWLESLGLTDLEIYHPIGPLLPWLGLQASMGFYFQHYQLTGLLAWVEGEGIDLTGMTTSEAMTRMTLWDAMQVRPGQVEELYRFEDGWSIVRLMDRDAFIAEGDAMGNCLGSSDDYFQEHTDGHAVIFSLRDAAGRSRASGYLRRSEYVADSAFHVEEISARGNADVPHRYALRIRQWLSEVDELAGAPVYSLSDQLSGWSPSYFVVSMYSLPELVAMRREEGDDGPAVALMLRLWMDVAEALDDRAWGDAYFIDEGTPGLSFFATSPRYWRRYPVDVRPPGFDFEYTVEGVKPGDWLWMVPTFTIEVFLATEAAGFAAPGNETWTIQPGEAFLVITGSASSKALYLGDASAPDFSRSQASVSGSGTFSFPELAGWVITDVRLPVDYPPWSSVKDAVVEVMRTLPGPDRSEADTFIVEDIGDFVAQIKAAISALGGGRVPRTVRPTRTWGY